MKYEIIKSKRKTLSIEITNECKVLVRVPLYLSDEEIKAFIKKHQSWIDKKTTLLQQSPYRNIQLSEQQIKELKQKAKTVIGKKVDYYSKLMGLYPTDIKITSAKKRFGSCSTKNSICFSYRLMLYPDEAIDYVVVHELAHIKHKNHSKNFYKLIEKYMPDYKIRAKLLKK